MVALGPPERKQESTLAVDFSPGLQHPAAGRDAVRNGFIAKAGRMPKKPTPWAAMGSLRARGRVESGSSQK